MRRISYVISFIVIVFASMLFIQWADACETCTIPRLGKQKGDIIESANKKWFFEYLFEAQDWHEKEAREAHLLHHDEHHFHDKTKEYIHHFTGGGRLTQKITAIVEIPYVIRHSIEIDDHSILGTKQRSEGIGDLHVVGLYEVWQQNEASASLGGGVKFPTGSTNEKNSIGTLFEPELQPGSGSYDYIMGGVYQTRAGRSHLTANLFYVIKTEGDADYKFGNLFSTSFLWEYLAFERKNFKAKLGIDANLQIEAKHEDNGSEILDSGGTTLLLGPSGSIEMNDLLSVFGSLHLPAYQELGGVHQNLDMIWTAGVKLSW